MKPLEALTLQMIRWLGRQAKVLKRSVYLTGDGSFATLKLFMNAQQCEVGLICRMKSYGMVS